MRVDDGTIGKYVYLVTLKCNIPTFFVPFQKITFKFDIR